MSVPQFGWMDGELCEWDECKLHVRVQGTVSGANTLEGIRGYWSEKQEQLYLFRLEEHLERLVQSAKVARIPLDYDREELMEACAEVTRANDFKEVIHLLLVAYTGMAEDLNILTPTHDSRVALTAISRPRTEKVWDGVDCEISSWQRISESVMPPRVKAGGNYHHGRLAYMDAKKKGFNNAILLDQNGHVTEAPGACVFMVTEGGLHTPLVTDNILESVTRDTILRLCEREGIPVTERHIGRSELYTSDEVFLCGSGAEVTPVNTIDNIEIGKGGPGDITQTIQETYFSLVRGELDWGTQWLTPVYD